MTANKNSTLLLCHQHFNKLKFGAQLQNVLKFPSDALGITCYGTTHTVTDTCDIHLHKKYETCTYLNTKIFSTHRNHSRIDILPIMFQ